jgi:hypothetical protein
MLMFNRQKLHRLNQKKQGTAIMAKVRSLEMKDARTPGDGVKLWPRTRLSGGSERMVSHE